MPELHPVPVVSPWYHLGIDFVEQFHTPSKKGIAIYLQLLIISVSLYKQFRVEPKRPVISLKLFLRFVDNKHVH